MDSRTAVIIGYGFTGQAIDRKLNDEGYRTIGVRRDWEGKQDENVASEPLEADITDRESLENLPEDPAVVINCVAAGSRGDVDRYEKVYYEGSGNLLDWARSHDPDHVIWTGSSSVYGQQKGGWVTEESETDPDSETGQILVKTEERYRSAQSNANFDATILRLTGIYGEGRARTLDRFLDGDYNLTLAKANKYLNMIHRDDIAKTIARLLESKAGNDVFNVTDDKPVTRRRFYHWLSQKLDEPLPKISGGDTQHPRANKRVSNQKLHDHLNLSLNYPTYKEGYTHILEERDLL